MKKSEPSHSAGVNVKGVATLEHSLAAPHTVEHRVTIWPTGDGTPRYPKEMKTI